MKDKEFARRRVDWLREKHRQPLKERARAVLGEQADQLLAEARRACKEHPGLFDASASHVRFILRTCVRKIPEQGSGLRRRGAYFRACFDVAKFGPNWDEPCVLELLDEDEIRALSDSDWAEIRQDWIRREPTPPIKQLEYKLGKKKFGYFFNALFNLVYDPTVEKMQERFDAIVRDAVKARSPQRYLRAVLRNERRGT